jgi:hypothetical protein
MKDDDLVARIEAETGHSHVLTCAQCGCTSSSDGMGLVGNQGVPQVDGRHTGLALEDWTFSPRRLPKPSPEWVISAAL